MRKRIFRALARALVERQVYECMTINWQSTLGRWPETTVAAARVQVREVERAELARLSEVAALEISAKFLRGLAPRPDRCFGAFVDDALISYVFLAPASPTAIDEHLHFRCPASWTYVYKAFTLPAWRGKRLLPHLLTESMRRLGTRDFVTLVVSDNYASRKAFERCGFRRAQRFPVWTVLSRRWPVPVPGNARFSIAPGLAAQVS